MRLLILADLHANWYALESVLANVEGQYDDILCCGDLVGYNPHPDRVVAWVRNHCRLVVRGNHDKMIAGYGNLEWFNEPARLAAVWTMNNMEPENLQFLRDLPRGPLFCGNLEFCHGSPVDEDEYITDEPEAEHCFAAIQGTLLFFGHSHLQGGFAYRRRKVMTIAAVKKPYQEHSWQLEVDTQYMVNPGSVGQPRDRDPRAAYAIYESETRVVSFFRVPYDTRSIASEIKKAGLPDVLAMRLTWGI